ncbi:MAG: FtsK/SpoIIIE domain-containing protein [Gordonia sp. (in: high G+C Gram-positive bacteria)]|uniref:FtsK/SpoIIIE domain-containing protein n=1 Tax=Gordonia sp. (in: high G+C Gram-positive bacteria) TaxID=84139 RepID=UPI003C785386
MNQSPQGRSVRRVYSEFPQTPHPGFGTTPGTPSQPVPSQHWSAESPEAREADRIEQRVRDEATELGTIVALADASITAMRSRTDQDFRERGAKITARVEAARQQQLDATIADEQSTTGQAAENVASAIDHLAPGSASAGWTDLWPVADGQPPARYFRVGQIAGTGDPAAALAPLLLEVGWYLEGNRATTGHLIQSALLRTVTQLPLSDLTVHVYDPRLSGLSSFLAPLRNVRSESLPEVVHDPSAFGKVLDEVTRLALTNADAIGTRQVRDLGEAWTTDGVPVGQFAVIVVLDYPNGIDEVIQEALVRLADMGPARGVNLIVQRDRTKSGGRGVKPRLLAERLLPLGVDGSRWLVPGLPEAITVADEGAPPAAVIAEAIRGVTEGAAEQHGPTILLADVLAEAGVNPGAWTEPSTDAVEAVIGRFGRAPMRIALRSENPPHPNLLVGGAVGQGKSNLLLDVIYSLAARYSPHELEMILLDFKQGLEFKRFDRDESGSNWLPHARILSLESNKAFGVAVLQYVTDEMVRRAAVFNAARCNSFPAYRAGGGEPMRRLLLIVDEFQLLFDGHDELTVEAVRLFETIAKQGRAYGIHVLLSSQTVSGITGLHVKGDSIFAQFPIRISLKNTAEESEAVLSRGNRAAADLSFRGEVIVNRNLGMATGGANERGIVAFAEPEYVARLQADLFQRAHDAGFTREPWVFLGRSPAQWPTEPPVHSRPTAWVGRPVEVTDTPVTVDVADGPDTGIALVGSGDEQAATLIENLVVTSIATRSATRVLILDGAPVPGPATQRLLGRADVFAAAGVEVVAINGAAVLDELEGLAASSVPTVVVTHTLHMLDLKATRSTNPETYEDITGSSLLTKLAEGRLAPAVSLISWWPHGRAMTEALGFDHSGIGAYLLLRVGLDDLRSLAGVHMQPFTESPRVGVLIRSDDAGCREVVPFDELTDEQVRSWLGGAVR